MERTPEVMDRAGKVVERTLRLMDRTGKVEDRTLRLIDRGETGGKNA
ncbi:hypothetical protein [Lysinibacillus cavernae]|nr:hypothetical protein [Lysinibacillus cavernae]